MVSQLIECLAACKSKMEYQNKDFDVDRLVQYKENEMNRKDHIRIQEKIRDVRQNFSKAVEAGARSGNGKIVFEHYNKLVQVWMVLH